jgi:hypothetical protein
MQTAAGVPVEMVGVIQGLIVLFVAAPKVIDWLANRGVSYAVWIQKDPKTAVPSLLMAAFSVIGAIIGIGIGVLSLAVNALITLALVAVGFVALTAFIGVADKKEWGVIGVFVFSAAWIAIGVCNFLFQQGTLLIPLLVLGVLGLILSSLTLYLPRRRGEGSSRRKPR